MLSTRPVSHTLSARSGKAPFTSVRPSIRVWRSSHVTRVANVTEAVFEEQVLKADTPVLVDFWAAWCGPCKLVAPLMDWAEKEYNGKLKVVKIEHDSNPQLIAKYKVYGLPTLIVFKDGEEIAGSKREGAITKALLEQYLSKHGVGK
ncbi:hypothetical protein VOLCADRAFT_58287 [Volvox carteri f. nagariensis]|uniref:Thioredoxin domain-containing protein n=1 Tax=Volvox carteri f. nagariensis TaxID=3068 RepID=D8TPZ8_VOLCA|nr:uncharacterized protein VOLCADRAFT_58287 [Volvox carteri f. nagariensis]EFJ50316.1 hypothetical protein VOLCADRAFT_58287 [Volvox carteri f. nagariensis]|eukprot:XP_002948441.1 hypothetical protein VOLCADRAFT_58287 [Volvox carteri f. nagariensis]